MQIQRSYMHTVHVVMLQQLVKEHDIVHVTFTLDVCICFALFVYFSHYTNMIVYTNYSYNGVCVLTLGKALPHLSELLRCQGLDDL